MAHSQRSNTGTTGDTGSALPPWLHSRWLLGASLGMAALVVVVALGLLAYAQRELQAHTLEQTIGVVKRSE